MRGKCRHFLGFVLVFALAFAHLVSIAPSARADEPPPPWIFPVVGQDGVDFAYYDTFGAARSGGRTHHGVDIGTYGVKGVPVVAAADGIIDRINWSNDPDDLNPERCCTISIFRDSDRRGRWTS